MQLPNDPIILLSYINTKLRDECGSLDDLCDRYEIDKTSLCAKLSDAGFCYNQATNQFV